MHYSTCYWFWGEMWPGHAFCEVHPYMIMLNGCTAEGGLYDDDFVLVSVGGWYGDCLTGKRFHTWYDMTELS